MRPAGMDTALTIYGLLPPEEELPRVTNAMIAGHEAALDAFIDGRWSKAKELLNRVPINDGPANFLRSLLAERGETPPDDWNGVIALSNK